MQWLNADIPTVNSQIAALAIAAGLDYIIGDPWSWPHPVQLMGKVIDSYTQRAVQLTRSDIARRWAGIGLAILLIVGSAFVSWAGLYLIGQLSAGLRLVAESILLASCFAGRSLRDAADSVLEPLQAGDREAARQTLAMYVGRDTERLSDTEMYRAVLETASENAVDGVLAPLFYAIVGAFFGLSGPVAIAYKAASTLDSMVGYRREPYTYLGWFSAQLEDRLTWLPCRLSVLTIALLSGKAAHVLKLCARDASADPSPNAGWSECAYAASLGVQLGGTNTYKGKVKVKPLLGEAMHTITDATISQAFSLTRRSFLLGLGVGIGSLYLTTK